MPTTTAFNWNKKARKRERAKAKAKTRKELLELGVLSPQEILDEQVDEEQWLQMQENLVMDLVAQMDNFTDTMRQELAWMH